MQHLRRVRCWHRAVSAGKSGDGWLAAARKDPDSCGIFGWLKNHVGVHLRPSARYAFSVDWVAIKTSAICTRFYNLRRCASTKLFTGEFLCKKREVHGFRSTFTDWVAECTNVPKEVADKALAHRIPNAVEAAYRRTDFLDRRRVLMNEWAEFLLG